MTQDEKWIARYNEVKDFIETNQRNPSRHRIEEHDMLNWVKQQRKLKNKGELKVDRAEKFRKLLEMTERYRLRLCEADMKQVVVLPQQSNYYG